MTHILKQAKSWGTSQATHKPKPHKPVPAKFKLRLAGQAIRPSHSDKSAHPWSSSPQSYHEAACAVIHCRAYGVFPPGVDFSLFSFVKHARTHLVDKHVLLLSVVAIIATAVFIAVTRSLCHSPSTGPNIRLKSAQPRSMRLNKTHLREHWIGRVRLCEQSRTDCTKPGTIEDCTNPGKIEAAPSAEWWRTAKMGWVEGKQYISHKPALNIASDWAKDNA
ncbi:hypothetical protein B0H17DRAFT_1132728 [Mycena rosella]|uniref:Uncharacterized protein n=1 Tax=Mycena rosella TaxID=1033263 RepID=A0AAD7DJZ0_MYCRO|nr:hypothetical protein B0H17DRAFT_1132728 [Mycena rosella]